MRIFKWDFHVTKLYVNLMRTRLYTEFVFFLFHINKKEKFALLSLSFRGTMCIFPFHLDLLTYDKITLNMWIRYSDRLISIGQKGEYGNFKGGSHGNRPLRLYAP